MELSGTEQKELRDALLIAYPTFGELEAMVLFELDENLEAIAGTGKLEVVIFNLFKWTKSKGKWERLIKGAYEQNPDNPELTAIHQKYFLISAQIANVLSSTQWQEVSLILAEIDCDLLQEACQATLRNITNNIEEKVPDILKIKSLRPIKEILLEKYPLRKDNIPTIFEFVERLANDKKVANREELKNWLGKIAHEKNITLPIYKEPKSSNTSANAYLLIRFDKNSAGFTLQAELIPNHQEGNKPEPSEPIVLDEVGLVNRSENDLKGDIYDLITAAKKMMVYKYKYTNYNLTVELFLPVQYLGRAFDLEEILATELRLKPIGYEYRFAVRSLDRYLINQYTNWGDYLNKFEQTWHLYYSPEKKSTDIGTQSIHCLDSLNEHCKLESFSTEWEANNTLAVNLAGCLTQSEKQKEFFSSLLRSGVPISLWNRCPNLDCHDVKEKFDGLMSQDSLKNLSHLFQKIYDLRKKAHDKQEKAHEYLGYHLGFLCDRPDRILSTLRESDNLQGTN